MPTKFETFSDQEKRELIFTAIDNVVEKFLYCDRKEDENLGLDDVENAIMDGVLSLQDIIDHFKDHLEHNLS